jgi:hypothetical protein
LVTEFNQLRSGLIDPASGQLRTNAQQVSSVLDGIKASLGRKENKFIVDQLIKAKSLISDAIPGYSGAQQQFAALSQPVNQSQILGRMQEVLASPAGGERVTPFLNAIGIGEDALIKTATGAPRYQVGDLNKVLAPNQMQQVTKVASELKRDASVAKQASEGREALKELLDDNISRFRLPQWISAPVALANRSLEELERKLGKDIMKELTKASQSGKGMDELLSTLPVAQRNKFLQVMQNPGNYIKESVSAKDLAKEVADFAKTRQSLGYDPRGTIELANKLRQGGGTTREMLATPNALRSMNAYSAAPLVTNWLADN